MDGPDALLARAQALLDVRRYDDAVALLGTAVASEPEHYGLQKTLARALLLSGRNKEAAQVAERAALLSPTDAEPHCIRAEAFVDLGYFHQGDEAAIKACEMGPTNARAHFVRVRSALGLDLTGDAWTAANRVLELVPYSSLGHHARGLVFIKRKAWREAEAEYRKALEISPNDPNLLNNCGLALHNQGRDKEAIEFFTRAGTLDARRDAFRTNTAIAARRHVGDIRPVFAKLEVINAAGPWGLFALVLIVVAVASDSPRGFAIAVGIFALCFALFFARRRLRIARLPAAARLALEIETQQRNVGKRSRPRRMFEGGAVLVLFLGLAALAFALPGGGHPNAPTTPDPGPVIVWSPEFCKFVSSTPGTDGQTLICPDPTSTSTTVDPFAP